MPETWCFILIFCSIHWRRMTVTYHIQPRSRPHSFPVSALHPSATVYKSVRRVSRKLEFLTLILNSKCNCSIFRNPSVASRLKCTSSDPLFHFPSVAASYTNTPHFFSFSRYIVPSSENPRVFVSVSPCCSASLRSPYSQYVLHPALSLALIVLSPLLSVDTPHCPDQASFHFRQFFMEPVILEVDPFVRIHRAGYTHYSLEQ